MEILEDRAPFQVFHSSMKNKFYADSSEGWLFKEKFLKESVPFVTDAEVLRYASDKVSVQGLFIELGVCSGKTINFIAGLNPHKKIYGFDSFQGLPEDWKKGNYILKKRTFASKNPEQLPSTLNNVKLIVGLFEDTLGKFSNSFDANVQIAFMHIDCDIYSSTATAFSTLGSRIRPGTILIFDELYNYPGFENHEFKALKEFLIEYDFKADYLAYNAYHEQVAIQITY